MVTQTKPKQAVVRKPKTVKSIQVAQSKGKQGNNTVSTESKKALLRGGVKLLSNNTVMDADTMA